MERLPPRLIRKAQNVELAFSSLPAIAELRRHLDELEEEAIRFAREHGASWEDIAEAVGITRQALQQRMGRASGRAVRRAKARKASAG